jgi:hypothetical protein
VGFRYISSMSRRKEVSSKMGNQYWTEAKYSVSQYIDQHRVRNLRSRRSAPFTSSSASGLLGMLNSTFAAESLILRCSNCGIKPAIFDDIRPKLCSDPIASITCFCCRPCICFGLSRIVRLCACACIFSSASSWASVDIERIEDAPRYRVSEPDLSVGVGVISWNGLPPTERPGKFTDPDPTDSSGVGDETDRSVDAGEPIIVAGGCFAHGHCGRCVDSRKAEASAAMESSMRCRRALTSSKRWMLLGASDEVREGEKGGGELARDVAGAFLGVRVCAFRLWCFSITERSWEDVWW